MVSRALFVAGVSSPSSCCGSGGAEDGAGSGAEDGAGSGAELGSGSGSGVGPGRVRIVTLRRMVPRILHSLLGGLELVSFATITGVEASASASSTGSSSMTILLTCTSGIVSSDTP
jgi:hypothetical protein